MILHRGNMFEQSKADIILFTANSTLDRLGHLVMGKGAALDAKLKYPGIADEMGRLILEFYESSAPLWKNTSTYSVGGTKYGVILAEFRSKPTIGAFQSKYFWGDTSSLELIDFSVQKVKLLSGKVALNFPGIGHGGLDRVDVLPILQQLPDTVEVWER